MQEKPSSIFVVATAFGLLNHGAYVAIVGFTMDKVEVRLSNLMAFHARALGNWGCPPELYPAALELVRQGLANKEISRELNISLSTTKWHLKNIFAKLQVGNRTSAMAAISRAESGHRFAG